MMPIATTYRGIVYRSRLEARWAAFFDRIGWQHTYEPFDGDGYIPDFVIHGAMPVVAEIKPAVTLDDYRSPLHKVTAGLDGHWTGDILILGADPLPRLATGIREWWPHTAGLIGLTPWWTFGLANWFTCERCGRIAVQHTEQPCIGRPCGHPRGPHLGCIDIRTIHRHWAEAINRAKWIGRGLKLQQEGHTEHR